MMLYMVNTIVNENAIRKKVCNPGSKSTQLRFVRRKTLLLFFISVSGLIMTSSFITKEHSWHSEIKYHELNALSLETINSTVSNFNSDPEFSFIVCADLQSSPYSKDTLQGIENEIKNTESETVENPVFCLFNGDMVYDGCRDSYLDFFEQITGYEINTIPLLAAAGNHDVRDDPTNFARFFGPSYYSFNFKSAFFVILNNSGGSFGSTQEEWLNKTLHSPDAINASYRFVFFHIPLYDPEPDTFHDGGLKDKTEADRILKILEDANTTLIVSSHIHGYRTGKWGNTSFVITGGGGGVLTGRDNDKDFCHFLKVNVDESGYSTAVIQTKTPSFSFAGRWAYNMWYYVRLAFLFNYHVLITMLFFALLLYSAPCLFESGFPKNPLRKQPASR
ncbi:MAG: metallophosphoesterase [Thermoplasmata archaeon]